MKNFSMKKASLSVLGLSAMVVLAGCGQKVAPIGDFNTAMNNYNIQSKESLLKVANTSMKLAEEGNNTTEQTVNVGLKHPKIGEGLLNITANALIEKAGNLELDYKLDIALKTLKKITHSNETLQMLADVDAKATADVDVLMKDKKMFLKVDAFDVTATGKNQFIPLLNVQLETTKKQLTKILSKWIHVDNEDGNVVISAMTESLVQQNGNQTQKEILNALVSLADVSYLEQDGAETTYNKHPAYKLKLNEDKFYETLVNNINTLQEKIKQIQPNYLIMETSAETESGSTALTIEEAKKAFQITTFEGYLVKYSDNVYKIVAPKVVIKGQEKEATISILADETNTTFTITSDKSTLTIKATEVKGTKETKLSGSFIVNGEANITFGGKANYITEGDTVNRNFDLTVDFKSFTPVKEIEGLSIFVKSVSNQKKADKEIQVPTEFLKLSEVALMDTPTSTNEEVVLTDEIQTVTPVERVEVTTAATTK